MSMRLFWLTIVACVLVGTGPGSGTAQGETPERVSIWNRIEQCHDFNLLRVAPDLIRGLDELAGRKPASVARCAYEAARLHLLLDDTDSACHRFKLAMQYTGDPFGRRAVVGLAHLVRRSGDFGATLKALHGLCHWMRSEQGEADSLPLAEVLTAIARVHLESGDYHRSLLFCEKAAVLLQDRPSDPDRPDIQVAIYELACVKGTALEVAGAADAARDLYWTQLEENSEGCARDPRVPQALERLFRQRGEEATLRQALGLRARSSGPLTGASILLEYLDFKALVASDNIPGLLTELEGIDPPIWRDRQGVDWHFFQAARDLVQRNRLRARDVVLTHLDRNGYFTLGVYILGLIGDERSLSALYRLAVEETSTRDLRNITAAIARNHGDVAARFLEQLQRDSSAAHPTELRRAACLALQSFPPPRVPATQ